MKREPGRIKFAHLPTPIVKLENLSKEIGKNIFVWRDDLTGFAESGNKVRKLEYLAADAVRREATVLVTCGGLQSNHARATAFVAKRMGMGVSLILRGPKDGSVTTEETPTGNHLLNLICGAHIQHVRYGEYIDAGSVYDKFLAHEADRLRANGEKPYIIPEGGSCPVGCFGYISAVSEMLLSWRPTVLTNAPDSLFLAMGSGGTFAGLHLGYQLNRLSGDTLWSVNVCDDADYFKKRVTAILDETVQQFDLPVRNRSLNILDGYVGQGYALATDEDLRFYMKVASMDGLLLDPVYTGKAFQGMLSEIGKDPSRFGNNILFLHSGGSFANFAFAERYQKCCKRD